MKTLSLFGATGSIGQAAMDVIAAHPHQFSVVCVTANKDAESLAATAIKLNAKKAVIADETQHESLKKLLAGSGIEISAGREALIEAAFEPVDLSIAAIVGMAGLAPLMASLESAKAVAIANKEPLVAAGALVMAKAKETGCQLLPLDSEHNAIFQVFDNNNRAAINKLILTASGGPFLGATRNQMLAATPTQALAHPNWSMGAKISIDSATMMNKSLEVIEAHHLFAMEPDQIEVLIHPQSVVHSMVEYNDGSVLAQMGAADMRTPLSFCLGWPGRLKTPGDTLDWRSLSDLTFTPVDDSRFPAIKLGYECLKAGQAACIAMNAANEIAVAAFLDGQIGFMQIVELAQTMVEAQQGAAINGLQEVLVLDQQVREQTRSVILTQNQKEIRA